ncbi:SdiA-regulated domain-containing protein [Pseudomonas sp. LS44]|uniref:SdiA-regulated domain-containing protein n=1 Tax=Pseudomonas sp. LS44 TaxID=1357074 RepID=UPI00215A7B40|nr:SdiA-regulated domain-containing protein [Pseudomonas sp. LS44]UVE18058.1 SdiA-regulated domain-containing protein [Pseudomonas sp. LS44]
MSISMSFLPRPRWLALILALTTLVVLTRFWHWDDRALFWLHERGIGQAERDASIWLPGYRAVIQAKPLAGLEKDETSDLAYNPVSRTLFTVTGKKPLLVELSLTGDVLRRIALNGFSNPEGVAVLADGNMAIIDERRRTLSIFKLTPLTVELSPLDTTEFDLGFADSGNKGFEGIAWDPAQHRLLLGKERSPLELFSWSSDGTAQLGGSMKPLHSDQLYIHNLSALGVDPRTGHTLVLSAQSNLLLEIDEHGEPVSFISLIGGLNGLDRRIPRAEGVAIDETGTIYMVSEPNLFYVFRKTVTDAEPVAEAD